MCYRLGRRYVCIPLTSFRFFFFNDPATTEIYTLSLHDALPISRLHCARGASVRSDQERQASAQSRRDRKSTRLNSSHQIISYAVFCLKKKKNEKEHKLTSQSTQRPKQCSDAIQSKPVHL